MTDEDEQSGFQSELGDLERRIMKAGKAAMARMYESPDQTSDQEKLEAIREDLERRLSEWVGIHIPEEGDEDYDKWAARRAVLDEMSTFDDVHYYAEAFLPEADEYLEQWGL